MLRQFDFAFRAKFLLPIVAIAVAGLATCATSANADEPVRFNRDIRPILANNCYQCHGPDSQARKGGFRLDRREQAIAKVESGEAPVVPMQSRTSSLIKRIESGDPHLIMPPPESNKSLTRQQKELLARWIDQGADYEPHWSLVAPKRPSVPQVNRSDWSRNEIDAFILSRLEQSGLSPSPAADLPILIRRLSLDLTGLPPTPADVDAFVKEMDDANREGHSRGDASSARAEATYARWINHYLNSPHYGERMAVDWLDAARFADTNGYQVDRDREMHAWRDWVINAFNTNLPFDRFTIEQIAGDLLPNASVTQKIATGFHRNHMMNEEGGVIPEEFLTEYCADRVETTAAVWLGQTFNCARCHDHKFDAFTQRDYYGLFAFFHNVTERGLGDYGANIRRSAPPFLKLPAAEIDPKLSALRAERDELERQVSFIDAQLLTEHSQWDTRMRELIATAGSAGLEISPKPDDSIIESLKKPVTERSARENKQLLEFHRSTSPERTAFAERVGSLIKQINELDLQIPTTLVMEEMEEPRVTNIRIRGAYDKLGDVVTANTPASLPAMSSDLPHNRLGLARWLVDPSNPLTARVTVNRLWQSVFGSGLVRTSEDFGTQGDLPSHPELLDWLADEFVRSGWDVKQMMRLLVTSATYRQSSHASVQQRERDPENRLLSRGPRFRLQAEFVRDQALAASGLLVSKIGGPSVKPYHPPGIYEQVTGGSGTGIYVSGKGEDLYRRGMYSYWKRSVPNPAMLVFDAPFRETCVLRRSRTNTPLQALNLMNDPTYVEASRFLAGRMLTEAGSDVSAQIRHGFRLVLARSPRSAESSILVAAFHRAERDFQSDPMAAKELLNVGETKSALQLDHVPLAAMTIVASTILNCDEAVMKE